MKSFNKLILPCLLLAHILIRIGYSDSHTDTTQSAEQLICSFEEQLQSPTSIDNPEAVFAIIE